MAISDSGYNEPNDAAMTAAPRVADTPMSGGGFRVDSNGFDIHYTPGEKRIGGLQNYRKAISTKSGGYTPTPGFQKLAQR
ncbi:hypothetical protein ACNKU7_01690 [Microbulbifer sp. SA54]|uniref:hypothetical protein n=1 Tax=Microbulbifer sp. SA54 TaxID=3401577 RepID=UPI003AACF379